MLLVGKLAFHVDRRVFVDFVVGFLVFNVDVYQLAAFGEFVHMFVKFAAVCFYQRLGIDVAAVYHYFEQQ